MLNERASTVLIVSLILCSAALGQTNTVAAIKCGRLINPADGYVTQNAVIIVRGERIEQVGASL